MSLYKGSAFLHKQQALKQLILVHNNRLYSYSQIKLYFTCGYSIYFIVVWSAFLFYNSRMYETGGKLFKNLE